MGPKLAPPSVDTATARAVPYESRRTRDSTFRCWLRIFAMTIPSSSSTSCASSIFFIIELLAVHVLPTSSVYHTGSYSYAQWWPMKICDVRRLEFNYQTTAMRTISDLESVAHADVGRVRRTHLLVDVLHGRVRIALIIGQSLRVTETTESGTMISCESMRLATSMSLSWMKSYTGEGSRVAISLPNGYVRLPHVLPPSTDFF